MAVPTTIKDLSTTASSNSPAGSDSIGSPGTIDDYFRAYGAVHRAESLNKTWERWNHTATYISATSFSVPTDLTAIYTVGRRLKSTVTAGTIYSTITASVFGAVTTVTVANDSGSLDSGLSEVQLGPELVSHASGMTKFLNTPTSANLLAAVTDETGTGALVFANTPTFVTPVLGVPNSGNLSNCTQYSVNNLADMAAGAANFLVTPSSANLRTMMTDETGTGANVFATSPTVSGLTNTGTLTADVLTTTGNTTLGDAQADTLNVGNGDIVKSAAGNTGFGISPVAGIKVQIKQASNINLGIAGTVAGVAGSVSLNAINDAAGANIPMELRATEFALTGPTGILRLNTTGALFGTALHNNGGAVTGATNQYIVSGTYTPTLTNVTNVAASTMRVTSWMRVGNVVTVGGQMDIDPTTAAGTTTVFDISLPIASAITQAYQLGGSGSRLVGATVESVQIIGEAGSDKARFSFYCSDAGNNTLTYSYTYEVL